MASNTQKAKAKVRHRHAKVGAARKRAIRSAVRKAAAAKVDVLPLV